MRPETSTTTPVPSRPSTSVHPLEIGVHSPRDPASGDSDDTHPHFRYGWDAVPSLSTVFRHSGWAPYRQRVYNALRHLNGPSWGLEAFSDCGQQIRVLQSVADPSRFKTAGTYCHHRFCVPCGNDRSRVIVNNLLEALPHVRLRFITLTIKTRYGGLSESIAHIQASFRKLQRGSPWRKHVTGGVAFLEVKRSSNSDNWHVHYHLLVQGSYWPHDHLRHCWHNVTGDSTVVDIRPCRRRAGVAAYAAKYAGKPCDPRAILDHDLLIEAIQALKGVHLCATFGSWRSMKLTKPIETGEWTDIGDLDYWIAMAANRDPEADTILSLLPGGSPDSALLIASERAPPPISGGAPADPQTRLFPDMSWYE